MTPTRHWFLAHNRSLAALSNTIIVVEAGVRFGALHTVRQAYDLGRNVGAIPGPMTGAASTGLHQLTGGGRVWVVTDAGQTTHMLQMHEALHESPQRSPLGPVLFRDHTRRDSGRDTPSL